MWQLVKEGVRYHRKGLLIAWGIGVGIFIGIGALILFLGALRSGREVIVYTVSLPVTFLIASAIACFVVIGTELAEGRIRLQLSLPIPIRAVAAARVLLPAALLAIGLLAAHATFAIAHLVPGLARPGISHLTLAYTAGLLLFAVESVPAVVELVRLVRSRGPAAALGWGAMLGCLAVLYVAVQIGFPANNLLRAGALVALNVLVMLFTIERLVRRTEFTH